MRLRILIILLFALPMTGAAQGPPIFTDTPIMLGLAGKGVRTFGHYQSSDLLRSYTQVLAVPYNAGADLQVGGILRFVNRKSTAGATRSGLGDMTIFIKQLILQKDGKGKTFRALIKATPTIPVGDDDVNPALGAGVWQSGIGLVAGYVTTDAGVYLELGHVFVEQRTDRNYYNIALSLPLLPQVYPPRQINLSVDLYGTVANGSRHNMWIAPGVQWITGRRLLVEGGVPIALKEVPATDANRNNFAFQMGLRVLLF